MKKSFHKYIEDVLVIPSERTTDIIRRRFGIGQERPQTLHAIGQHYDITRERVRQIVRAGLAQIQDHDDGGYKEVQHALTQFIRTHGGIMQVERLYEKFAVDNDLSIAELHFLIAASVDVDLIEKHKAHALESAVHLVDFDFVQWGKLHDRVHAFLTQKGYVCTGDEVFALITDVFKSFDSAYAEEHLHVSSDVKENPFGKWGLSTWSEVTPKSIRDKVFLVLENEDGPLHFRDIAQKIDDYKLGKGVRKTHPQTVHNELIKDDRFVLSGRGTYSLANDGYIPGSVRDVITSVLSQKNQGLEMDDVISHVLKHRDVKPSTIKINLHAIAKNQDGRYILK